MNRKSIVHITALSLLTVLLLSISVSIANALPLANSDVTMNAAKGGKPDKPPRKPSPTSVDIRSPGSGENLLHAKTVNIIAEVKGTFATVKYKIGSDQTETIMTQWRTTNRYTASWIITQSAGNYVLYVTAYDAQQKSVASATTTVTIVTSYEAVIWYEIDYISGHKPTQAMLDYWVNYWDSRAIIVHTVLDSEHAEVTDPKYTYLDITLFWEIESIYNDDLPVDGDDRAYGNVNNGNPFIQEKWMLWGAHWYQANIGGFCYVWRYAKDGLAGNYIYINDGELADWEGSRGLTNAGGRIVALMHEAGHSVGVITYRGSNEFYDPDYYSVMSEIRSTYNAAFTDLWYYSQEYWKTRNLDYY